jgi:hypothetical protein
MWAGRHYNAWGKTELRRRCNEHMPEMHSGWNPARLLYHACRQILLEHWESKRREHPQRSCATRSKRVFWRWRRFRN